MHQRQCRVSARHSAQCVRRTLARSGVPIKGRTDLRRHLRSLLIRRASMTAMPVVGRCDLPFRRLSPWLHQKTNLARILASIEGFQTGVQTG